MDLLRSKRALVAENAMLRQQLIVATRRIKRPRFTSGDRVILVLLSMVFTRWREVLLLVRPETLLRWASPRIPPAVGLAFALPVASHEAAGARV